MGRIYNQDYTINYFDSDLFQNAKITSILRFFENNAVMQSESLEIGLDYYEQEGVIWVLHKWDVKINRIPKFKEKINVTTQPYSFRGFYAYRYYEVLDSKGEKIITANTEWLFLNAVKKRPIKIISEMYNKYGLTEEDNKPLKIRDINAPENYSEEKTFSVRRSDIDSNHHVNNIQYVEWAVEAVPDEIILRYDLTDLIVVYKKEANPESEIFSRIKVEKSDNRLICHHLISDKEKDVCVMETVWEEKIPK